ncbi:hypothetical protein BI040_gp07 [Escherichia phage vB_EcoS_NBD2]|uniref:Uncharacterized protein n=1 Tax=Escherichia phage vB_EcoS_NBD2 TaxID=1852563 RepID=A0A192Y7M5_9CAUD|nr:hypothetical protein BI040_gp07 [Escherichia phage vB_EcoS_NBD2]ANM45849.1 hypothetical protein NBD2_07 [Escherichia phage vB_EcoS_NBD2]
MVYFFPYQHRSQLPCNTKRFTPTAARPLQLTLTQSNICPGSAYGRCGKSHQADMKSTTSARCMLPKSLSMTNFSTNHQSGAQAPFKE